MSDNDTETRHKAAAHGGWVGETILRLLDERDAGRAAYAEALKQMAALQEVYVAVYTERDAPREALWQFRCLAAPVYEWGDEQAAAFRRMDALLAGYEQEGANDE